MKPVRKVKWTAAALLMTTLSFGAIGCADNAANPASTPVATLDAPTEQMSVNLLNTITKEVNLTESQQPAFKKLTDEIALKLREKKDQGRESRKAEWKNFAEEFKKPVLGDEVVKSAFTRKGTADAADAVFFQKKIAELHDLLTPAQRAAVAKKIEEKEQGLTKFSSEVKTTAVTKMMTKGLNLTPEQESGAEKLLVDFKTQMESKKGVLQAEVGKFTTEFRKEKMDESVLQKQVALYLSESESMKTMMATKVKAFHALLTPEQRADVAEKMGRGGFSHHRGGHKGAEMRTPDNLTK